MPLTKYQLRSEYGLADPELYRAADKDDPEALLEGVAMAGLVGILRQLGDLAEFAAEMFHDLHEEVMATAARGHGLMVRVQQLEAEFPSIEKALLSRTDHSPFFSNTGVDWHPNVQLEQSLITRGDLPRCVMDSYEECRGPPRLFLLDKFDVAGAGACLKRYSDPSFFRLETLSSEGSLAEIHREKKYRKSKKRGSRCRNGGTPEISSTSHAKLHELFLEERVQGVHADPARLVKLKTRKLDGYLLISKSGESYMEKFVETCVDHKPDYGGIASNPELLTWNMDDAKDSVTEVPEISMAVVVSKFCQGTETEGSSPNEHENLPNYNLNGDFVDKVIETVPESTHDETEEIASTVSDRIVEKHLLTNLKGVSESLQDRKYSEDLTSEVDNYVDAPATMESETETDDDGRTRNRSGAFSVGEHDSNSDVDAEKMEDPPLYSDSQSVGNTSASENGRSSFLRWKSSFSYSDAASISTENDPSDREKTAELVRSTGSCKNEPVELSSNVTRGNKDAHGSDSPEQELTDGSDVDHQASCTSLGTNSSSRFVSQNAESHASIVQSLAPEIVGASRESSKHDLKEGGRDESRTDPFDSSGAWLLVSTSEGNRCDTAIADTNITSCAVDYVSESLANSGTDYKKSDVFPTDRKLHCSASLEVESSTNDIGSKLCDPIAAADIHSDNSLDDEGVNVTTTKVVSSECSPTFGSSTDESVSDSREVTLVNVAVMSTEIIDNKGFHDDVRLDSETLEIESKEEPAVSGNDADAACGDVNHVASTCSPSDVSDITCEMASGAKELCHNNALESDRTLLAECNPEFEGNMQTIPFEGTDIDDKDLANGESTLRTSQNLIDADPETKSTHPGTILDNSIDSFLLDHQKPSETPLEHSMVLTDETILQSYVCKGFSSECVPQSTVESNSSTQALNLESTFPRLSLIPDTAPPSLDEIPPLPPLPPVQWRLGKVQHFGSPAFSGESVENIKSPLSAAPPVDFGLDTQITVAASPEFMQPISLEQLPAESANNASDTPSLSHIQFPTAMTDSQHDSCGSPGSQSADPSVQFLSVPSEGHTQDFGSSENKSVADHTVQCHEPDETQETSLQLHHDKPAACEDLNGDISEHISPSSVDADQCPDTKTLTPMKSTEAEEDREAAEASNILVQKILPGSVGDAMWPVNAFAVAPTLDTEKPNEIPTVKLPRPRSPLVDAVAAHDRSTMRKVSERTRSPMESKEEDNNSFLAQIRNKSFNLKPAAMKRPNMKGGPKTNLKVAAILEKANTIRQAMAGSDEDDHDSDSWSDS